MKRLKYDVSKWHTILHRESRGLAYAEPHDPPKLKLEDEVFEKLYSGGGVEIPDGSPYRDFAEAWHKAMDANPEFLRLQAEVRGDEIAAAEATAEIMRNVPSPSKHPDDHETCRKLITWGSRRASKEIEKHRDNIEGLEHVNLGGRAPGSGITENARRQDVQRIRNVAQYVRNNPRFKRIAELAGRFKRIASNKRRSKVKHGADEISDIEQGNDLGRILPSELMKLGHEGLRLSFLKSLLERQALQYQITGAEAKGKGPLVVCLDKSGSMSGARDEWATAIALALLDTAQKERRTFALICFTGCPIYESIVKPGGELPLDALCVNVGGGTDVDAVLHRGLEIIALEGGLKKADLVLITDGDSYTEGDFKEKAKALQVTTIGIGIGTTKEQLGPWCDETFALPRLELRDDLAEALFAA